MYTGYSSPMENERDILLVVRELLDELLEDVISQSEWDVAGKGQLLLNKLNYQKDGTDLHRLQVGPQVDVCQLVRETHSFCVLTCFSLRGSAVEVLHMQCIKQHASGYCGHYAVYFSLCCLEACFSSVFTDSVGYLAQTSSIAAFWRRYWFSVKQLLLKVKGGGGGLWWPWTIEHVLTGDMERSYFAYLLEADPHLISVGGKENILVLHYAYGCIQSTAAEVHNMQLRVDVFCSSPTPACIVFVLGVTNHWVTLLAYKVQCRGGRGNNKQTEKIGLVYLDSNNVPVLTASDHELVKIVEGKERARMKRKGRGYSEWKRRVILQAYTDQRDVVHLLAQVLCNCRNLCTELLTTNWTQILNSYDEHVLCPLSGSEDREVYIPLLLQWLNHWPPQSFKDIHLNMLESLGVEHLDYKLKARLKSWLSHCQKSCNTEIDTIVLFWSVLEDIRRILEQ